MTGRTRSLLFWMPRILAIAFALFVSVFALDVFGDAQGLLNTTIALLMHLVPTAVLLLTLAAAWRMEWIGAIVYAALGAFYIASAWGRFPTSVYVLIAGPLFVIAAMFLIGWLYRDEIRPAASL